MMHNIEKECLKLGFKYIGKNKDLYRKGVFLHRRKRGWVTKSRAPIIDSMEKLEGYLKYAFGQKL